jgi:hypothetical protein
MFRRTNAIVREITRSAQAAYMSVCITGSIMEYRVKWFQSVLLHYGYKWIWLPLLEAVGRVLQQLVISTYIHSVTILTGATSLDIPLLTL